MLDSWRVIFRSQGSQALSMGANDTCAAGTEEAGSNSWIDVLSGGIAAMYRRPVPEQ
jgi:hypothetical protein